MEKEAYRQHFELEEAFWWFLGRREAIRNFLARSFNGKTVFGIKPLSILDVGCGTGGTTQFLEAFGKVWGVDFSSEAIAYCRKRYLTGGIVQGSALHLPFPDERFDLITACDLLSHKGVEEEFTALQELYRVCKKGGHLLLTDSAFECLRSAHDRFLHGVRRYTVRTLKSTIEGGGFRIERISYMNMTLFPFICLWRRIRQSANGSDLKPVLPFLNRVLTWIFFQEARWLRQRNLPFGTSLICLARKT